MGEVVHDLNKYNPAEHNGYNYAEYNLVTNYAQQDERMDMLLKWADFLQPINLKIYNEFVCNVRMAIDMHGSISDNDFVRLYRIYIRAGVTK